MTPETAPDAPRDEEMKELRATNQVREQKEPNDAGAEVNC